MTLLSIPEVLQKLAELKPDEEFGFQLNSVIHPFANDQELLNALVPIIGAQPDRCVSFRRGCSQCSEHQANPLHHEITVRKVHKVKSMIDR